MNSFSTCLLNNPITDGRYGSFVNSLTNAPDIHMVAAVVPYLDMEIINNFCVWVGVNTETTNDATLTLYVNDNPTNTKLTITPGTTGSVISNDPELEITSDSLICWKASGNFTGTIKLTACTILFHD